MIEAGSGGQPMALNHETQRPEMIGAKTAEKKRIDKNKRTNGNSVSQGDDRNVDQCKLLL